MFGFLGDSLQHLYIQAPHRDVIVHLDRILCGEAKQPIDLISDVCTFPWLSKHIGQLNEMETCIISSYDP